MFSVIDSVVRYLQDRRYAARLILHSVEFAICDMSDGGFGVVQSNKAEFLLIDMHMTIKGHSGENSATVKWTRKFTFRGKEFQRAGLQFTGAAQ